MLVAQNLRLHALSSLVPTSGNHADVNGVVSFVNPSVLPFTAIDEISDMSPQLVHALEDKRTQVPSQLQHTSQAHSLPLLSAAF